MLLTLPTLLVSCGHKCEFSTEWSKDDSSHWHVCTGEECTEIADKADHNWNDGEITTEPTQEEDGVKIFTCNTCFHTKTETVEFTGMTEKQWDAAFSSEIFANFMYREKAVATANGNTAIGETIYKFTKDSAWVKMTVEGTSRESTAPDTASANQARKQLVDSIKAITAYSDYTYDAETRTYKANKAVRIASLDASTSDITLKFNKKGQLIEIKYTVELTKNSVNTSTTSTITLSSYGLVVLATPSTNV